MTSSTDMHDYLRQNDIKYEELGMMPHSLLAEFRQNETQILKKPEVISKYILWATSSHVKPLAPLVNKDVEALEKLDDNGEYFVCIRGHSKGSSDHTEIFRRFQPTIFSSEVGKQARQYGSFYHFIVAKAQYRLISEIRIKDERTGRDILHSEKQAARIFSDRQDFYLFGIHMPEKTWKKVIDREITPKEVIKKIRNVEVKSAIIRFMGYDIFLKALKPKIIDMLTISNYKGQLLHYQLFTVNLRDDRQRRGWFENFRPATFIKVQDHSTLKDYVLRVNPDCMTCKGAIAWSFGKAEDILFQKET